MDNCCVKLRKFIEIKMTKTTIFTRLLSNSITGLACIAAFPAAHAITTFTGNPVPGGVAVVDMGPSTETKPQVRYGAKNVLVIQQDGHWKGLVGISLKTLPGNYIVSYQTKEGNSTNKEASIKVVPKTYPEQRLKMKQKKYVSPNKEQLTRIKKEKKHMGKLFKVWRDTDVAVNLSWPVDGPLSSPFGLRRFFNDQPRNPHSGIDIAAPEGTDIVMPSDGMIIDTGNYYFNGNTVFVDHGQGMISMFNHMSKITAKNGDKLKRGDKIGEIGSTGRVTGPHLHWSLSLNEARVDPMLFLPEKQK